MLLSYKYFIVFHVQSCFDIRLTKITCFGCFADFVTIWRMIRIRPFVALKVKNVFNFIMTDKFSLIL